LSPKPKLLIVEDEAAILRGLTDLFTFHNFDVESEQDGQRGLGGNAGNVLIDGVRPTSKTGGLTEVLKRIPADQVIRIEVLRGGNSAGETAGQSIVANVIRAQGSTSGTWDITSEGNVGKSPSPRLQTSLTTQLGQWQTSFSAIVAQWESHRSAQINNFDPNNNKTSIEDEDYLNSQKWLKLIGEGSRELSGGKLSLNGYVYRHIWLRDSRQDIENTPAETQVNTDKSLLQDNRAKTIELGADWTKSYNHWKLRLIGLGMLNDVVADNTFTTVNTGQDDFTHHDVQDSRKTELVSRMTLANINNTKFKPEFGFELANNKLDSSLHQFQNNVLQASQDNDKVAVEEVRAEVFASFVYQASDVLSLEG
jgi:outer membrane cobalamin receptor